MFIVHVGWNGCDGGSYTIAGVFSKKAKAFEEAKKVAESGVIDEEFDTVEKTDSGYTVEVSEESGMYGEASTTYVYVEKITLDKPAHVGGQI